MIDLEKIGYNVIQKDGDEGTEITGGLTLTVRIRVSALAPDPEGLAMHVKKRIREKIWDMAYGHLKKPFIELKETVQFHSNVSNEEGLVSQAFDKLEEAIGEP